MARFVYLQFGTRFLHVERPYNERVVCVLFSIYLFSIYLDIYLVLFIYLVDFALKVNLAFPVLLVFTINIRILITKRRLSVRSYSSLILKDTKIDFSASMSDWKKLHRLPWRGWRLLA